MLSIIISTREEEKFKKIRINIHSTIGATKYEIIKILNPGEMGLSKAYNKGAALAQFNNLLFLHDDVEILTSEWGEILIGTLELENSGVVGLAGGTKKFILPTGHDVGIERYRSISVIHKNEKIKKEITKPVQVKILDGVFLALRKERWQEFKFNENLDGFHFYDLDISLRASKKYKNYIAPGITLFHFSKGRFNDAWIEATLKFHKKTYNFDLPDEKEKDIVRNFWFRRLLNEDISFINRLRYVYQMGLNKNCWKEAVNFLTARHL